MNLRNDLLEQLSNLLGNPGKARIVDRAHRRDRIDRRNLDPVVVVLLNDHVAGKHRADFVFDGKCLIRQVGVACAQYKIGAEVDAKFFFARCP